jgi:hypothetical protein
VDSGEVDEVRSQLDALARALADERVGHVAGLSARPAIAASFDAHGVAASRGTVEALRERGEKELASRVAALAAGRAASTADLREFTHRTGVNGGGRGTDCGNVKPCPQD